MVRNLRREGIAGPDIFFSLDGAPAMIVIMVLVECGVGYRRGGVRLAGGVWPVIGVHYRRPGDDKGHQHGGQRRHALHPGLPSAKGQNPLPCSLA
jgi:hypothetical protein